jgi:hypothetical protein
MSIYNAWDTSDPALKKMNSMVGKSVLDITHPDCKDFYIRTRMRFLIHKENLELMESKEWEALGKRYCSGLICH